MFAMALMKVHATACAQLTVKNHASGMQHLLHVWKTQTTSAAKGVLAVTAMKSAKKLMVAQVQVSTRVNVRMMKKKNLRLLMARNAVARKMSALSQKGQWHAQQRKSALILTMER
jgi:hypothetical protein